MLPPLQSRHNRAPSCQPHPVFNWTLPFNEESDALYIANKPDTTPEGKFYDENVVDIGIFTSNEREYSPTSPLYAGAYWWLVWSNDVNTYQSFYSAPSAFMVAPALTLRPIKTHRYLFLHELDVAVGWQANVHGLTAKATLLRHGKVIWKKTESESNVIGYPGSATLEWHRPHGIKQGTRLTLQVSIYSAGAKKTRTLIVRAP
ncbi:MAG TPA: hypothetical protein VLK53_12335 [Gaiellaceae bacterium]|nr:hypothetical protein [Gaiellaceae bacterium]